MTVNGLTIPKGAFLYISFISLHNSALYWDRPQVFDPDRWLTVHDSDASLANDSGDERCARARSIVQLQSQ